MRAPQRLRRGRRAAMADPHQRRDVAGARQLLLAQRGEDRRDHERRRDLLALDQVECRARLERRQDDLPPGVPHRREHSDRPGEVEQRRDDQPTRVAAERPAHLEMHRVGDEIAVGQHHSLRSARRPARVEETRYRVLRKIVGKVGGPRPADELLVAIAQVHDVLDR